MLRRASEAAQGGMSGDLTRRARLLPIDQRRKGTNEPYIVHPEAVAGQQLAEPLAIRP